MKIAALAFCCLLPHMAFAQDSVTLETIQVRGTKEGKDYFQNTGSVLILKESEVPAAGRSNDLQILNAVPNVSVNKGGESFSIRGISNIGVTGYQKDNLASIVIDDLFQTDLAIQAGSFNLWDMDRIEVLRGAQSTNQGVNSLAGSILLDHKKPVMATEGAAKIGAGNFGHKEIGVVTNNVLSEGKIATRLSYDKEMNDGYIKNIATDNDRWGMRDRDRVMAGLTYKVSDTKTFNINAKYHRNDQGGTYVQGSDPFKYEVDEDQDYKITTANSQLVATYAWVLSDYSTNTTIFGASYSDQNSETDADGTSAPTAGIRYEDRYDHFFSIENRLTYQTERVNNLFGLHAHDFQMVEDYDFNLLFPLGASSTPVAVKQAVDRTRKAYAIFDSITFKLDQNQALVGGLRGEYVDTRYWTDVSGQRLEDLGGLNPTVDNYIAGISGAYEGTKSDFVVLPKIGYTYTAGLHHAGLTYTRAYRTAGVSINRRRATAVEYGPEYTNNYELSYKYGTDEYQFSSNLFYIDWQDQQVQVQLTNDFYDTQVQNAAKSEVYGAEVEGRARLTNTQTVRAGVGYSDTKFKDFQTRTLDYNNKKFPFAAHWTARLSHEWKPIENWGFLTVARYLDKSFANAENTRSADAQFLVDLNARYVLQQAWMLEGYVNNLLDGQYRLFDGTPTSTTSPYQASYHQVVTPREFGLRLNYFW